MVPYFVVVLAGRQARLRPPPRLAQFLLGPFFNLSMGVQYETNADILLCRYTPAVYAAEKAALEESLPYRAEPLRVTYYDERPSDQAAPTLCLGSDTFRFLDSGPDLHIPFYKNCALTVTNDETHEIAFIYYTDTEADGVESMTEFLERECFWGWIR